MILWNLIREDPNLALAGLRVELENKLRQLVIKKELIKTSEPMIMERLLELLKGNGVLNLDEYNSLRSIVQICNKAVHGAKVDFEIATRVLDMGETMLGIIDDKLQQPA